MRHLLSQRIDMNVLSQRKEVTMGKGLFAGRSVDEDTRILSAKYFQHESYDLLLEQWKWDCIKGKSLIFLSPQTSGLDDSQFQDLARDILGISIESETILKRSQDYTYFNFDFQS